MTLSTTCRSGGRCLLAAIVLLAPVVSAQPDVAIRAAELVAFGIFEARSTSRGTGSTALAPPKDSVDGAYFTKITNRIPATLGTNFGIHYVINSTPKGRPMRVKAIIRFPEGGLREPGGRVWTHSEETLSVPIGERAFYGYGFDEAWEIVPGEWTFEVWHSGAQIVRKTFIVGDPDAG